MVESLASLASLKEKPAIRAAAIGGLARRDLPRAAHLAAVLLSKVKAEEMDALLVALLQRREGADALADTIKKVKLPVDVAKLERVDGGMVERFMKNAEEVAGKEIVERFCLQD